MSLDDTHGETVATAAPDPEAASVTTLRRKDLLGIGELTSAEIGLILDTAEAMK